MAASQNVPRVLMIDGRNVKIYTSDGQLVITFGYRYASDEKELRFTRTGKLPEQIVIRGTSYTISGDAIQWCQLAKITRITYKGGRKSKRTINGIQVLNVDTQTGTREAGTTGYPRFNELTSAEPERDQVDYRRLQIMCESGMPMHDTLGLDIHRYLIASKISEQAGTLRDNFASINAGRMTDLANAALEASDHETVKTAEADASAGYFDDTWRGHSLWSGTDCPESWRVYSGRASGLTKAYNRDATDPVNAALNYAYTILLYQTVIAMRMMRLDPELSIDHSRHEKRRYAGAMDVMEPARPIVDRMVLDYLTSHTFGRRDFFAHTNYAANPDTGHAGTPGQVSLGRGVRHAIASMGADMFDAVAPFAYRVAAMLHDASELGGTLPDRLLNSSHKAANARRRAGKVA